jgi:hypothetical protein
MACTVGLLLSCSLMTSSPAPPTSSVDLELVLAVDASVSMNRSGRRFERDGYVQAFETADVVAAVRSGPLGRIAVTLVEWSGADDQSIVVPWTILSDETSAAAFADAIDRAPLVARRHGLTAVGSALLFGAQQIMLNDIRSTRRVIDISGNGAENDGVSADNARAAVLRNGITINALPLPFRMISGSPEAATDRHEPPVEAFYRDHVAGGEGSFVISVTTEGGFAEAIRRKLVREIAGRDGSGTVAKAAVPLAWR